MRKVKIFASLFAVTALLFAGAFFPKIISEIFDRSNAGIPSYHNIPPLQLHLNDVEPVLTTMEKFALLSCGMAVNISQNQATMTEAVVQEAVYSRMVEYEKALIFQWFEPTRTSMQPYLMYDPSDSARHFVVWTVAMIGENQSLLVEIDDETGNILRISYEIFGEFSMDGIWERNKAVMDKLIDIYFSQLGLYYDIENATISRMDYREVDGGLTEMYFVFEEDTYGIHYILFNVYGTGGFDISFYQ